MASNADIANLALARLKVGQAITSLDEQTNPARICNRFFTQCRQEVLQAFPWGCALTAEALAEVADQTFPGWAYVYQYPSECLRVHCASDESGMRSVYSSVRMISDWRSMDGVVNRYMQPWRLAMKSDGASRVILSDVPTAWAFFTADADNPGLFEPDLVSVMAWRLAMEVGGPLQAESSLVEKAEQKYSFWLASAASRSFNESKDDPQRESPSILARY